MSKVFPRIFNAYTVVLINWSIINLNFIKSDGKNLNLTSSEISKYIDEIFFVIQIDLLKFIYDIKLKKKIFVFFNS